ncbi:MAG: BrxA family protein [Chloroflexales bacterium]
MYARTLAAPEHAMETMTTTDVVCAWRATGPYRPTVASKNGLVAETRLFLAAYRAFGSVRQARDALIDRLLPQRSRETRVVIARNVQARLTRWNPPTWVLDDLVQAGQQEDLRQLQVLLLVHHARQETLLYDAVQNLIVPRWRSGALQISRDDALAFLTDLAARHAEVGNWSYETRVKLAGNLLTTLCDYGLLTGRQIRQIVEPAINASACRHLNRLLTEEGVPAPRISDHPDWRLWLMSPERVRTQRATLV